MGMSLLNKFLDILCELKLLRTPSMDNLSLGGRYLVAVGEHTGVIFLPFLFIRADRKRGNLYEGAADPMSPNPKALRGGTWRFFAAEVTNKNVKTI
jgi:hypothetical protein